MDIEDQIPPLLPLPSGSETALGRRQKGGISPLWPPAHRASGPEGKEGLGEIFGRICLLNDGLLSSYSLQGDKRKGLEVMKGVKLFKIIGIQISLNYTWFIV